MRYTPVKGDEDLGDIDPGNPSQTQKTRVVGAMILLCAVAAFSATRLPRPENLSAKSQVLMVSNEYERARGFPLNDGLIEHMVQVHKLTRLELASNLLAKFSVEDSPGSGNFITVNEEAKPFVEHVFEDHGVFQVKAVLSQGEDLVTHDFTVNAKIIRYEIRDLSESDRQLYFDTLQKFYFTGQEEGEAAYGANYKSISYLVREHLYGAADKSCDHWHDDAGILTHHVGVTWEMETSMRMISPATASHYWDYTREEALGIEWYDSPIFGEDWFGSNSPNNLDHIVDKGRFAYTPVSNAVGFSDTMNPYGLLRSPWNTNPTPYLLRSNETFYVFGDGYSSFPTCSKFAAYVDSSLALVLSAVDGELHGPVHLMVGGHWNIRTNWEKFAAKTKSGSAFLLLSKWLWRQGFVRTPGSCSSDVPGDECMPTCPELITGTVVENKRAYELLTDSGVIGLTGKPTKILDEMASVGLNWVDYWKELCHVGWPGEMFTSAAPQDPTFWPLHGNAERFVMYLRVLKKWGIVSFDETWGYSHAHDVGSNTGMVCDWSGVTDAEMPTCVKDICPGHREDDLLPFTNLYAKQGDSFLTNAQLMARIDPFHDDMPYAYDSLSYWQGCTDSNLLSEYNALYDGDLPVHEGVPYWKSFVSDGVSKDAAAEAQSREAVRSGKTGPGSVEASRRWWGIF